MAYSLNDISGRESFILCDSSITSLGEHNVFEYLSTSCGYNELNVDVINRGINLLNTVQIFLKGAHINIIPEVKKELQHLVYKVERKKNEFDLHKNSVIMTRKDRDFKFIREFKDIETIEESLFNEFYDKTVALFTQANKSIYFPGNPLVHRLCSDLVCIIEEYGQCRAPHKYYDSSNGKSKLNTDENMIATGLYRSFFENKSTAILTGDEDFINIFCRGINHIFADDVPFNTFFLEYFIFFPIRLYEADSGSFRLSSCWDLIGDTKTEPVFSLTCDHAKNNVAKQRVDGIMRALMKHIKNSN